jgi:hypothetical protein
LRAQAGDRLCCQVWWFGFASDSPRPRLSLGGSFAPCRVRRHGRVRAHAAGSGVSGPGRGDDRPRALVCRRRDCWPRRRLPR